MKSFLKTALVSAAVVFVAVPSFAQDAVRAGADGTAPLTPGTGVGPDSKVTGYSASGRGGTGGMGGGATTNGTAAGAGTATGGNPGGYPDSH